MPLCSFPERRPAPRDRQKVNNSLFSQAGKASLAYGTAGSAGSTSRHPGIPNGTDKAGAGNVASTVSKTDSITKAAFDAAKTIINTERARRGRGAGTYTTVTTETLINHTHFNQLRTAIQVSSVGSDQAYATNASVAVTTYPAAPAQSSFPSQTAGTTITAANINKLIADINNSNSACTCNCNYCSCNCNYCTCNCNYACTCNCNYSDVTTKNNIVYM